MSNQAHPFDQVIDRSGTSSQKWLRYSDEILPLWVADSDFLSPPAVIQALQERVSHGIFGYTNTPAELKQTVVERLATLYQWQIKADDLVWLPGLVCGLNLSCRVTEQPTDQILAPEVIYPPFKTAPTLSDRTLVTVPVHCVEQRWLLDFERLEQLITPDSKMLLFCNPQNPGGTVYRKEELEQLAELIIRHDLLICSDEIHCDLILNPEAQHIPIAALNEEIAARTITLMAPSKTYNIAGLGCSFAVIQNQQLRKRFLRVRKGIVPDVSLLAYTAALAAYQQGDEWNQQQLAYLQQNQQYLLEQLNAIEGLTLLPMDATYLAWIDVSALQLDNPPAFFEAAGVGMSAGKDFGDAQFMRLNFACPKATLEEAVKRIKTAVEQRHRERS